MKKATLAHRIQYGVYRTFEFIMRHLPVGLTYQIGALTGRALLPFAAPLKRTVMRNLQFAFEGEKTSAELHSLLKEVFKKTTGNLLSSIRIPFLSETEIKDCVTLTNLEILQNAIAKNKGTILLIPHMGNWELLAQSPALAKVTVPFATHYRPLNNPLLNQLIERRRKKRGVRLFPKRTSSHTLCAFLRENGILGILADQRIPRKGDLCAFFGRPTSCSPLPALLAKRTEAEMIGLHCKTIRKDHWELTFTKVSGRDSSACAANLEHAWRSSPGDVFWFQDRWKLPKQFPLQALCRTPFPPPHSITKPLKIIVLNEAENEAPPQPEFPFPPQFIEWIIRSPSELEAQSEINIDLIITTPENASLLPGSHKKIRTCHLEELLPGTS